MIAKDIKEYGLSLGYSQVGITSAEGFPDYMKEVESRGDSFDFFAYTTTNPMKDAMPKEKMPDAKSVIVLVWDYYQMEFPDHMKEMIGKAYMSRSYGPQSGSIAYARLELMKKYLENKGCKVDSTIGLPARWAGAQAGVTSFGRNNFAYAEGCGSYIIIYTLVIDKELDYDEPTMECLCPPDCRACINACPTGALYEPFHLEPSKCIAYNNWMTQEGRGSIPTTIPMDIREKMGCHIHGCDICQDVCPRNQAKLKQPKKIDPYIQELAKDITLPAILHMTDDFYENRIRPIMYNYIKEKRYLIRNAAIAMGNSGNSDYIKDLEIEQEDKDEMIREAVHWALKKLSK